MIVSAAIFFVFSFITYLLIALFGHLTGGSPGNFWQDVGEAFKPIPLLIILVSNFFFAAAISYGFKLTPYAIPASVAIGILASFTYSVAVLHAVVTPMKLLAIALILIGIYLLR